MKIRFRKTNQLGFLSLHAILPVAAAVLVIGGVGSYVLNKSGASSVPYLTKTGCELRGRNWVGGGGNPCGSACKSGTGALVTNATYNYCKNTVSRISQSTCASLHRAWLVDGCARRADQKIGINPTYKPQDNPLQCAATSTVVYFYFVSEPYDYCALPQK